MKRKRQTCPRTVPVLAVAVEEGAVHLLRVKAHFLIVQHYVKSRSINRI